MHMHGTTTNPSPPPSSTSTFAPTHACTQLHTTSQHIQFAALHSNRTTCTLLLVVAWPSSPSIAVGDSWRPTLLAQPPVACSLAAGDAIAPAPLAPPCFEVPDSQWTLVPANQNRCHFPVDVFHLLTPPASQRDRPAVTIRDRSARTLVHIHGGRLSGGVVVSSAGSCCLLRHLPDAFCLSLFHPAPPCQSYGATPRCAGK
eukprot:GGOE01009004.1.p1 GENE.GGOE01009004.1~~GGOE01009004.1.p1  ORF type:complete len:201 (-),score=14.48 GGOE01009004.1:17-619(-)